MRGKVQNRSPKQFNLTRITSSRNHQSEFGLLREQSKRKLIFLPRGDIHSDPRVDETSLVATMMVNSTTDSDREALKVHFVTELEKGYTTSPSPAMEAKWLDQPTMTQSSTAAQTKARRATCTHHVSCRRMRARCTSSIPLGEAASLK